MRPGIRLGLDFGDARIGVARSDPAGTLAVPVEVVRTAPAGPASQAAFDRIAELVGEYEPIEVLIGLPLGLSGREGPAARKVRAFAVRLRAVLGDMPLRFVDERLSTVEATRAMRVAGTSSAKGRGRVDSAAAAVIVQTALDTERATGAPAGVPVEAES